MRFRRPSFLQASAPASDLVGIIGEVRRRWRMKLALRGAAIVAALGALVLLGAAWALESLRFTPGSILTFRIVTALAFAALIAYWLVRPLLRRVSDEQVALYLEEHEPSLEAAILSAVDSQRERPDASKVLVGRLVEQAIAKCQAVDGGRRVERVPLHRSAAALGAVAVLAGALYVFGPPYLRYALSALLVIARDVEAAAPYRIDVTPGHATIPRGADQAITARLKGFDATEAWLLVRKAPDQAFERVPLVRNEARKETDRHAGDYDGMLFDVAANLDYVVEAAGVRSPLFKLTVVDVPYVQRLELEYHFPAYTGLAPQKIEDGGDIAVPRGTEVRVRAIPTIPAQGGQIVINDDQRADLKVGATSAAGAGADTSAGSAAALPGGALSMSKGGLQPGPAPLEGSFTVQRDGFYRIDLAGPKGELMAASPQYTIDVLSDQAPAVSFSRPGRDTTAAPLEEVFVEAQADDDYGVRNLQLVYSVNGAAEKTISLFEGRSRLEEVTAGHTFYLEELGVQPGDFVSYYARASDNDLQPKSATSDIYFLRIRPFNKEFKPAQSMAGGMGGGMQGGDQVGALSEQQRQIIAATFNVNRDRKTMTGEKLRESTTVIALSQARLREQVEGLVTRMNSRLVEPDPAFKRIAELLPKAIAEMNAAEAKLSARAPEGALPPEQRALGFLQKAEEEFELQVSVSRNAGGGGGGGAGSIAEDLADLFGLELDRMANQYETAQRAEQQQADQQLDELLEKLKELARRQEQEAERQRRRALAGQMNASGGGSDQRGLADQVEEAARRLEKLSRDENRPELMDSARRLREAADAMRRSAAGGGSAAAQASAALERLREAERRLQRSQAARADRDVKDAQRQAEELMREQREIAEEVRGLEGATGQARQDKVARLLDRKDQLESKVAELEKQLDRSAADIRRDEKEAARKLSEAAGTIRDTRVRDRIRWSKAILKGAASTETSRTTEAEIGSNLEALRKKLGEASAALGQTRPDRMADTLDKAGRLTRGMDSLDQRMRERRQPSGKGAQAGDQRSEAGGRGSEAAGRGSEAGGRGQEAGGRGQEAGGRGSEAEGRGPGAVGRTADGWGGDAYAAGPWRGDGGWGQRPWRYSPEDIRQWRGEVRQWTNEAVELRRMLREQGIDPREFDEILKGLRALDDDRAYKDAAELERLQTFVTEGLKRFEYGLRRRAEGSGSVNLSGADEVPEQFRKLVEQYYRSLAKTPRN